MELLKDVRSKLLNAGLLVAVMIYGCSTKDADECSFLKDDTLDPTQSKNIVTKDIPLTKKRKHYHHYETKLNLEKLMDIGSLENGFDSISFRIWYANPDQVSDSSERLVIISKKAGDWSCLIVDYIFSTGIGRNKIISVQKKSSKRIPVSGWIFFASKLFEYQIDKLPDVSKIKSYPFSNYMNNIVVEVATINHYRMYRWSLPIEEEKAVLAAKNILNIRDLIEKEVGN